MSNDFHVPDREADLELVGYLRRWCLTDRDAEGKQGRYYLHNIQGPDEPCFHDHPWSFRSVVLSGGYKEMRPGFGDQRIVTDRMAGTTREMNATDPHYISEVLPNTWTRIITGPVVRHWGFYDAAGQWVLHSDYEGNRKVKVIRRNGYQS